MKQRVDVVDGGYCFPPMVAEAMGDGDRVEVVVAINDGSGRGCYNGKWWKRWKCWWRLR